MSAWAYGAMAGLQVWSGLQQAEMIRDQAALNDRINKDNAKYLDMDAWEAEKFGYTQTARYASIVDQTLGKQEAVFAAQNIDSSVGSAAAIKEESKLNAFLNTLDIQRQARAKALGLKVQASNVRLGSDMNRLGQEAQASAAQMNSILQAGRTLTGYIK